MPFLRLTRDRRGIENTFLLHADHPGERPRVLDRYRTAPGIALGRPPLDEEAIRSIEDSHPHIDFDWPAILALSEVMMPEDEVVPVRPKRKARRDRDEDGFGPRSGAEEPAAERPLPFVAPEVTPKVAGEGDAIPASGLLAELVGREIAARLRGRYQEIRNLIHERESDEATRDWRLRDAQALNPDGWSTAEAILEGVRGADALFDRLRAELD